MNRVKIFLLKYMQSKGLKIVRIHSDQQKNIYEAIFAKYAANTMLPQDIYTSNLELIKKHIKNIDGDILECGVWKGGMIAGIADLLKGDRTYFLFDSFEGLPPVKEIDGCSAKRWQENSSGADYHDNCSAPVDDAEQVMKQTNCTYKIIKGWFNETLPKFEATQKIALLRLDGDWYDSTLICLQHLYPKLSENGLLIIDDYYEWDGCSRAVHDYLSEIKSSSRIKTYKGICYIIKKEK